MSSYVRNASGRVLSFLVLALLLSLLSGPLVFGQVTSGTIYGRVKDTSNAYIPGATVKVRSPQTGVQRTVTTNDSGDFVVPNMPPDTYTITVEAQGFKKLDTSGIVLSAADKLNAGEFTLSLGANVESVTVTADAGQLQLQTNSGERSDVVTSRQLNDVALNGRNVLDYLKLVPGVSGMVDGHQSGTGGLDSVNINGTRANQHEYTIDGASNVDTGNNGGTHVTLNTDAIEEVKILTSNYQAEFGKAAGGQIAVTTKGGTNSWHGNGRFFHRNEGLNANEWFNKQNQLVDKKPNSPYIYRYNYVGYQAGGPILKNRFFIFWSQEFYRQFIPIGGTTTFYTPTDLERQGDFSQSVMPVQDRNDNTKWLAQPIKIYDANGNPFPGNKIDPSQLSASQQAIFANISKILSLYPEPNVPGFGTNGFDYNYSTSLSYSNPRREDILRGDYQINPNERIFVRWIHNSDHLTAPFSPGGLGAVDCMAAINFPGGCKQTHPGWNVSLNLLSTITPTILNEFSIGPSVTKSTVTGSNGNISLSKNGITLPLLYPSDTMPDMSFGGLNHTNFGWSYLGSMPWHQANTTINVNDNLTWVRNKHTLKFGVFYQRNRKDQIAWGNVNGQFSFDTAPTAAPLDANLNSTCPKDTQCGDPLASALLGNFQSFGQSTSRPLGKFRYNQLEFYAQDTWKFNNKLTLDYGMRFAWIPAQYDDKNQIALFDPALYDPSQAVTVDTTGNIVPGSGNTLNGMRYVSNGTLPKGGWNNRLIMPEPRIGFAYDVFHSHKTVVRGGFGMMHDRVQGNLIFNPVFNNPQIVQTAQVSANNISNLPGLGGNYGTGVLGNIVGADRTGQVPTVYSYSLGVQQELGRGTTLDVAYVGTLSRHLVTSRDINAVPYGYAFTAAAQDPNACGWNGKVGTDPYLAGSVYESAGYSYTGICALGHNSYTDAPLVPYKGYGQISYMKFDGTANYNSLQASLQRRFTKGLTLGAVYTYSHTITTANGDQDTQDPFNPRALDYRSAGWDRRQVFAANYVYNLPKFSKHFHGPGWLSYITDNYELSGVTNVMSGAPIDMSNNWQGEPGAMTGGNMWGALPFYYTLDKGLNPIYPVLGAPIRGSRDRLRTGGLQTWDMSLFKNVPIGSNEARYIQLRLEAFNVFNHPNKIDKHVGFYENGPWQWQPGTPFSITKNADFGTYSDTPGTAPGGFRVIQLGAKVYF
ncbi:MAG TPA: TonB-dependent receptor [Dongiaceae bacterium]|nr:TonB-dependent receptor [Dongiaceae bacterium]